MDCSIHTITVIIPVRNIDMDIPALECLKRIDYPLECTEVILVSGRWPSLQRNRAAKLAQGEILYFFNADAIFGPEIFRKAMEIFDRDSNLVGVGGPDLTPQNNTYLQRIFGYAMSSLFAHWKMRARYSVVGKERVAGEKDLLLSNMAVRKDVFLKMNGFNESLYPNEENELINRISELGYKFVYSPHLRIWRNRRTSLLEFIRQFYRYGQGRMGQIFVEGVFLKNLCFFVPTLLLLYFLSLPFLPKSPLFILPMFLYFCLAVIDAAYLSFKNKRNLVFILPLLYLAMHLSYGAGMPGGLFSRFGAIRNEAALKNIKVKHIKRFSDPF